MARCVVVAHFILVQEMKTTGKWTAACDEHARILEKHESSCEEFYFDNRSYYCHMVARHGKELINVLDELGLPFSVASLQGRLSIETRLCR